MKNILNEIKVSACQTHHLFNNQPLYEVKFHKVLKFHSPGLASVVDNSGAYHINLKGKPAYNQRYWRTFGFYCNRAAVATGTGCHHINGDGQPAYDQYYDWCGNYQEGVCVVRDIKHNYYHINLQGQRLSQSDYFYAGDFKDGIAVVCLEDGKSTHINTQGHYVHQHCYRQLDIFHKDYARAQDQQGWFHITRQGYPAYTTRFASVEPFYNGQAHAQTHQGDLIIIDEQGQTVRLISATNQDVVSALSQDLVGFWRSETIRLAVDLGILDHLPAPLNTIVQQSAIPVHKLIRLMYALKEIGIVSNINDHWHLTTKGQLLVPSNNAFMAAACYMWHKVQQQWSTLKTKLTNDCQAYHPTFKEASTDQNERRAYDCALNGYALHDFKEIAIWPMWDQFTTIGTCGYTGTILLNEILKKHAHIRGIILNKQQVIFQINNDLKIEDRVQQIFIEDESRQSLELQTIILPRFLHYFPDKEAFDILNKIHKLLPDNGQIFIFEMILNPTDGGGGLLDLNMLAESGGKLRTNSQWHDLLNQAGFVIDTCQTVKSYLHLIHASKC